MKKPKILENQEQVVSKSKGTKVGIVVSAKMAKTVVVKVTKYQKHPIYKKQIKRSTKFKVHDDMDTKIGQKVKIAETKPISKDVHFKILEVIDAR